jgi:cyclopropane fatty-acyl-phospholipid synthase-like methyltransferase
VDWKAFWNDSAQLRDSDCCRQVGRTFKGVSYSEAELDATVQRLLGQLDPHPQATLLDLGCGNGLITSRLAAHFKSVTGVDFSRPLIDVARARFAGSNVRFSVGDATDLDDVGGPYDRVLMCAALQFISPTQAVAMFRRIDHVLAGSGRVVLADVADGDRKWNFYKGLGGKVRYASGLLRGRPIIGHWWRPAALRRIVGEVGWTVAIEYQPATLPNHYFRYDAILQRAGSCGSGQEVQIAFTDR